VNCKKFEVLVVPDATTLQYTLDLRSNWRGLRIESHVVNHNHVVVLSWESHSDGTPCQNGETPDVHAFHNL